jgi:type IV secretion system protein VirB4
MKLFRKSTAGGDDWFQDAGDPSELISITRPISDDVFATRTGGYGAKFSVEGVDTECLSNEALATMSSELLTGQRLVPEEFVSYQIVRKRRGFVPTLRHTNSSNPVVAETQIARQDHLAKVGFSSIELFLTLYVPPPQALQQWSPGARSEATEEQIRRLDNVAQTLAVNLERFKLKRLNLTEICGLYGYVANLHGHHPLPSSLDRIAEELPCETVQWNDDGIKVGSQYGKLFSLLRCPKGTHPNLFGELLRLDADLVLVLESQRRTVEQTCAAVSKQETFTNFFREKMLTLVSYFGDAAQLAAKPKSASSLAADKSVNSLSGVITDLDNGIAYTQTSLIGVLHSTNKSDVETQMAHVHRVAGVSQGVFLSEGLGALCAFISLFPGAQMAGRSTNVRRRWISESHVANLSLVHAPYRGEAHSKTLENEAHSIFETRDGTDFAYDPYTQGGVRGCFILGETGRGKSFLLNFLIDNEPKYGGYVFVFDVGGSFESTVLKHDGKVVRFGLSGPRLNPFALADTPENHRFVQRLVRMLLAKGGAHILPQQETELNQRVSRPFRMDRSVRRLKHLILPAQLQVYLDKWIEGGVYGTIFDNLEDELELSRMVVFDLEALGEGPEQKDLMEPLLSWIRWRIAAHTHHADNLGLPKLEIYDEVWRHLQDEQMAAMILNTSKTARKHLGGIMLATQSVEDLGKYATLIRTNCPDAILMGGSFSRKQYELFELNDQQLDLISSLNLGEFLFARKSYSKVCKLSVDEHSKWLYSTDPNDRRRRNEAIATYGREDAFRHLVARATAK